MIGLAIGLLYSNAVEWVTHKYVLHGLGKKKGSMWAFHWAGHHRNSRSHGMYDSEYLRPVWSWNGQGKEIAGIAAILAVHTPLFWIAPYFAGAVWYSGFNYLYCHRKAHLDPDWAWRRLRSHYEHHMGKNQDANWCVTRPWFDWIMGTRERFDELAPALQRSRAFASAAVVAASTAAVGMPEGGLGDVAGADSVLDQRTSGDLGRGVDGTREGREKSGFSSK